MVDAVTTQILNDGMKNAVIKFTNVSDGTGEAAVVKVDVSALSGNPDEVRIDKIWYSTDGMAVQILWDATADEVAWLIPANQSDTIDFGNFCPGGFGGINNNAGAGKTGDISFTTVGHTSGDTYSIILWCSKLH